MTDNEVIAELWGSAIRGDERSLARLLTLAESDQSTMRAIQLSGLASAPQAQIIGITGAPGVGKSTLVAALIGSYRQLQLRVAVVAIDPSSPITGGALLGDRIRMQPYFLDPDVYIRSMSSRGHLGGLASATPDVIDVVARCGFDRVIVETVGVGQAEVEIATYADSVLVVTAPGAGDSVQAAKAGILETADIFVVNKADLPGSGDLAGELRQMLTIGERREGFNPTVVEVAARDRSGLDELANELERHREWLETSGELDLRRRRRVLVRLRAVVADMTLVRIAALDDGSAVASAADQIISGEIDLYSAAELLLNGLNDR